MKYKSTRSAYSADGTEAVLRGIAPDGGLFIPLRFDGFDWQGCLSCDSLGIAERVIRFLLPDFPDPELLVKNAYVGKFETEDLTPLVKVGKDYVLELFRGPTSAFKDVALSMLPQLVQAAKKVRGDRTETVILTATSGDTGKAALEGFRDVPGTKIIVFYPDGGVSPVQYAQMASQEGKNVTVCAVRGNFDDCQTAVKRTFSALAGSELCKKKNVSLSSANSINIGRLVPQISYYFIAYAKLAGGGAIRVGDPVDFTVPTGNFGDILAGCYAKKLGLPVGRLICASNSNNVLTEFFESGVYDANRPFLKTSSPSMDILVSSNLERLLRHASGSDEETAGYMRSLAECGRYELLSETFRRIRADFDAAWGSEEDVRMTIRKTFADCGYLCDTHTAVALYAAEKKRGAAPMVVLSTASPYKFPAAVLGAIAEDVPDGEFAQMERLSVLSGVPIPENLAGLKDRPILHHDVIDEKEITDYVISKL